MNADTPLEAAIRDSMERAIAKRMSGDERDMRDLMLEAIDHITVAKVQ